MKRGSVFVVAEIGINHNGDMKIAKKLIDWAVLSGCDAVKFQKRTIDNLYSIGDEDADIIKEIIFEDEEFEGCAETAFNYYEYLKNSRLQEAFGDKAVNFIKGVQNVGGQLLQPVKNFARSYATFVNPEAVANFDRVNNEHKAASQKPQPQPQKPVEKPQPLTDKEVKDLIGSLENLIKNIQ